MFLLGSFLNWLKQLWINKGFDRRHIFFAAVITLSRFLMILPRLCEKTLLGWKVRSISIEKPPVFIIGHWRSGTTFLHNVLARDQNFGHINMMQSIAPDMFMLFGKIVKIVLKRRMPAFRPMDNMSMSPDVPQEEEVAMANRDGGRSFYLQWIFPRRSRWYFEKYALLETISDRELTLWKKGYKTLLKKITLASGNRRLVLKNPVNTARISALLDIFPDAKFIHIYRSPYLVFPSTINLYDKMIAMCGVENVSQEETEENILRFYEKMMKKYFSEKEKIPQGNLVEIKFEELEADPMTQLQHIYAGLSLPGFSQAEPVFREYIASLGNYRKNRYVVSPEMAHKIRTRWRFAFTVLGYDAQCVVESPPNPETAFDKTLLEKQDTVSS